MLEDKSNEKKKEENAENNNKSGFFQKIKELKEFEIGYWLLAADFLVAYANAMAVV